MNEPYSMGICHTIEKSIEIVNQLAEEYNNKSVKTNADYIRNMTNDELATFLSSIDHITDEGDRIVVFEGEAMHDNIVDIEIWLKKKRAERRVVMNSKGIDCLGDNGVCIPVGTHLVKTVKKQTNADKIRSMDDEELAEFINTVSNDSIDTITACGTKSHTEVWEDKESTMQWLQSEAE